MDYSRRTQVLLLVIAAAVLFAGGMQYARWQVAREFSPPVVVRDAPPTVHTAPQPSEQPKEIKVGPFRSPEDITNVPGIGEAKYSQLKDLITVH